MTDTPKQDDELRAAIKAFFSPAMLKRSPRKIEAIEEAITALIDKRVREATKPPLDLNAYENQLSAQVSDIEAFNLFIRKWCPHATHLLDTDDNDGQYIRDRLAQLKNQ